MCTFVCGVLVLLCSKGSAYVVAGEVVDGGFGEHRVVCVSALEIALAMIDIKSIGSLTFQLRFPQRRSITSDDYEFGFAGP